MRNRDVAILFDEAVELFRDLIGSGLYRITTTQDIKEFNLLRIIHNEVSDFYSICMFFNSEDSMIQAYLCNKNVSEIYRIKINPEFYSYQKVPDKYVVGVTNDDIENVFIDAFDSHEDAVLFVNKYQSSDDFYSNGDLSIYKLTDFYKGIDGES